MISYVAEGSSSKIYPGLFLHEVGPTQTGRRDFFKETLLPQPRDIKIVYVNCVIT